MNARLTLGVVTVVGAVIALILVVTFAGLAGETGWPMRDCELSRPAKVVAWILAGVAVIVVGTCAASIVIWGGA